jgi:hypothetical protein
MIVGLIGLTMIGLTNGTNLKHALALPFVLKVFASVSFFLCAFLYITEYIKCMQKEGQYAGTHAMNE